MFSKKWIMRLGKTLRTTYGVDEALHLLHFIENFGGTIKSTLGNSFELINPYSEARGWMAFCGSNAVCFSSGDVEDLWEEQNTPMTILSNTFWFLAGCCLNATRHTTVSRCLHALPMSLWGDFEYKWVSFNCEPDGLLMSRLKLEPLLHLSVPCMVPHSLSGMNASSATIELFLLTPPPLHSPSSPPYFSFPFFQVASRECN